MKSLPKPSKPKLLLAFDFDGTLYDPRNTPYVAPQLFEKLQWLSEEREAIWGIATGRDRSFLIEGLIKAEFPFSPDFIITKEREIHYPGLYGGWIADNKWNKRCEKDHHSLFRKARKALKFARQTISRREGCRWVDINGVPAGIVAREKADLDWFVNECSEALAEHSELRWERNGIYLRFSHEKYRKGGTLLEVAQREGITPRYTYAAGDNLNDLSMLDLAVAHLLACPANSEPLVKVRVRGNRGHVSEKSSSFGILDTLDTLFPKNMPPPLPEKVPLLLTPFAAAL